MPEHAPHQRLRLQRLAERLKALVLTTLGQLFGELGVERLLLLTGDHREHPGALQRRAKLRRERLTHAQLTPPCQVIDSDPLSRGSEQ